MKKLILLFLMLITLNVFSQRIEVNQIDDFTKTQVIRTNMLESTNPNRPIFKKTDYIDTSNDLLVSMLYNKNSDSTEIYYLQFLFTSKLGCLSKYNGKVMIMLDDNTILEFKQISDTDCSEYPKTVRYILISENDINNPRYTEIIGNNVFKLLSYKVLKIRIYGSKYYHDFEIKPEKQNIISSHLNVINGVKDIK